MDYDERKAILLTDKEKLMKLYGLGIILNDGGPIEESNRINIFYF